MVAESAGFKWTGSRVSLSLLTKEKTSTMLEVEDDKRKLEKELSYSTFSMDLQKYEPSDT